MFDKMAILHYNNQVKTYKKQKTVRTVVSDTVVFVV